jgi:diadenosine tetraphosphate (Ap4A) HIT family hydrolase
MNKAGRGNSSNCCLCEEVLTGEFPSPYGTAYGTSSRLCYETTEAVALPTVSPLTAGHMLVLPRAHVTSLAALPESGRHSLLQCATFVADRVRARFDSDLYVFEHGARESGRSCGVDHAHLHILPLQTGSAEAIGRQIRCDFPYERIDSLDHVLSVAGQRASQPYLLWGKNLDSLAISFADEIPSQYVRRLVRAAQGREDWDWKLLTGTTDFSSAFSAFK